MKDELSRIEDILQSKIDGEPQDVKSMSRIEKLLEQLNAGGGSVDPSVLEDIAKLKEQIGNANVNIEDLTNSYTKLNKSVNSLGASVVNTTNDVTSLQTKVTKIEGDYIKGEDLQYGRDAVKKLISPGSQFVRSIEIFELGNSSIDLLDYIKDHNTEFWHSDVSNVGYSELTVHHYTYPGSDYLDKHWPYKDTVLISLCTNGMTNGLSLIAFDKSSNKFAYAHQGSPTSTFSGWISYLDEKQFTSFTSYASPLLSSISQMNSTIAAMNNRITGVSDSISSMSTSLGTRINTNATNIKNNSDSIDALEENVQVLDEEVHDPLILDNILEAEGALPEVLPSVFNDATLEEMYLYTYFIPKDGSSRIPDKQAGMETLYNLIVKAVDKRVTDLMKKDIEKNTARLNKLSFAQDEQGNWGYKVDGGADTVTPFKKNIPDIMFPMIIGVNAGGYNTFGPATMIIPIPENVTQLSVLTYNPLVGSYKWILQLGRGVLTGKTEDNSLKFSVDNATETGWEDQPSKTFIPSESGDAKYMAIQLRGTTNAPSTIIPVVINVIS